MTQASVHIDRPFSRSQAYSGYAGARHVKLYLLLGAGPTWSGPPPYLIVYAAAIYRRIIDIICGYLKMPVGVKYSGLARYPETVVDQVEYTCMVHVDSRRVYIRIWI